MSDLPLSGKAIGPTIDADPSVKVIKIGELYPTGEAICSTPDPSMDTLARCMWSHIGRPLVPYSMRIRVKKLIQMSRMPLSGKAICPTVDADLSVQVNANW
jgi:hypothetical protein